MSIKKTGKMVALLAATAALAVSLINDKKNIKDGNKNIDK